MHLHTLAVCMCGDYVHMHVQIHLWQRKLIISNGDKQPCERADLRLICMYKELIVQYRVTGGLYNYIANQ